MPSRRLLWQLYPPYLLITVLFIAVLAVYSAISLRDFFMDRTAEDLEVRGLFLEHQVSNLLALEDRTGLDSLCKHYGRFGKTRITIILPTGRVLGDSDEDPARMENHADRSEVIAALSGDTGRALRYSHTMQQEMMYLALPLDKEGNLQGILRVSTPVTEINTTLGRLYWKIALGGVLVLVLMFGINLWVFRRISRPLEELRRGAEMFSRGELHRRLPVANSREVGELAGALNRMSAMLSERIDEITRQRNELESLLAGMTEGVIVVDREERVVRMNQAAGQLFGARPEEARGRIIQEVVRNSDLQRFIAGILESNEPAEGEVTIHIGQTRHLQVHGTLLPDEGQSIILIVLNDVTHIRQLENVRREFVANVSHELKTPITAIKGFVETLLDGAMKEPDDLERFLGIILKHTDRLNRIIEDILELSRIEQEAERREIVLEQAHLKPILNASMQTCRQKAEAKNLELSLDCPAEISLRVNAHLLELAVANLLDNAIKYSPEGENIELAAYEADSEIVIRVSDHGPGIEPKHLDRLFERFYRVDKARSRNLGGTGLGLSIVKHICQVHHGRVDVESELGRGSNFFIYLPRA